MEISNSEATNIDSASPSNGGGQGQILQFPSIRFLRSPISSLIEYSGLLRVRPEYRYSQALQERNAQNPEPVDGGDEASGSGSGNSGNSSNSGEVSIRIIGDQDRAANDGENVAGLGAEESTVGGDDVNRSVAGDDNSNREGSSYQRYDIQQAARWIEQILPFSLLLLVVFIRQHLQDVILKANILVELLVLSPSHSRDVHILETQEARDLGNSCYVEKLERKVVEYFNELIGERDLIPNIESGHLEWDKLKRKGGHLGWDGTNGYTD